MITKPKKRGGNVAGKLSEIQARILAFLKESPGAGFKTGQIAEAIGEVGNRNLINTLGLLKQNLTILRLPGRIQKVKGGPNEQTSWTYHE